MQILQHKRCNHTHKYARIECGRGWGDGEYVYVGGREWKRTCVYLCVSDTVCVCVHVCVCTNDHKCAMDRNMGVKKADNRLLHRLYTDFTQARHGYSWATTWRFTWPNFRTVHFNQPRSHQNLRINRSFDYERFNNHKPPLRFYPLCGLLYPAAVSLPHPTRSSQPRWDAISKKITHIFEFRRIKEIGLPYAEVKRRKKYDSENKIKKKNLASCWTPKGKLRHNCSCTVWGKRKKLTYKQNASAFHAFYMKCSRVSCADSSPLPGLQDYQTEISEGSTYIATGQDSVNSLSWSWTRQIPSTFELIS